MYKDFDECSISPTFWCIFVLSFIWASCMCQLLYILFFGSLLFMVHTIIMYSYWVFHCFLASQFLYPIHIFKCLFKLYKTLRSLFCFANLLVLHLQLVDYGYFCNLFSLNYFSKNYEEWLSEVWWSREVVKVSSNCLLIAVQQVNKLMLMFACYFNVL